MLFNSIPFFVFFALVFLAYIWLPHRKQNTLLLVASYFFYASWDWRFLSLIWISTAVDYIAALRIDEAKEEKTRRAWLFASICCNLGILFFFKYFNFFIDSFQNLFSLAGYQNPGWTLRIVLPVGISFYTFQTMSYTIDVFRKRMKPVSHLPDFALYVAFFPQLVAGPIERGTHLLPQILQPRHVTLEGFRRGLTLFLWGLFCKVMIADSLGGLVDEIFAANGGSNTWLTLIGCYAFSWQIFADFSGYSDMARGLGRMLGFDIMLNFRWPYFSANIREFWQRWHISLSTWLRDYLYIPLGGNRKGSGRTYTNLLLTMLLGGLWHGAAWTFVLWGGFHGLLLASHRILDNRLSGHFHALSRLPASIRKSGAIFITFHLVALSWIFFRSQDFSQAAMMISSLFHGGAITPEVMAAAKPCIFYTGALGATHLFQMACRCEPDRFSGPALPLTLALTLTVVFFTILSTGVAIMRPHPFIYFQF